MATKSNSQISTLDDEPEVAPEVQAVAAKTLAGTNHDSAMSGKKEIVTIHSSPEDGGSNAVFIGLNGYAYQIPRDEPFAIPTEVAQILRDAKVTTHRAGPNGSLIEKTTPRYAFSAVPA